MDITTAAGVRIRIVALSMCSSSKRIYRIRINNDPCQGIEWSDIHKVLLEHGFTYDNMPNEYKPKNY
jgi:hypothetical protein